MDSALRRPGFNSSSDFIFKLVVLAVLGLSASESQVRASNLYKRDNTNSLNSVSSWATTSGGGTSPSSINSTDIGVFDNALSAANALKLSLDGNLSIGSLQFNGNLNGPITVSGSSTLTLNNAAGIDMSSANHDVTVECAIAFGIDQTWAVAGGQTLTVNGIVSGPGQLTKTGPGNLVLNRNNTFSGGTLITGGRVIVGNTNAFGPNSTDVSAITVSDAGTLDLNGVTVGAHSFAYGLTLGGSGFNGQGALINSGGDGGRNGLICLPNLSLFDDAAIGGSGNIYIVSHSGASYVPTSLEMNGRKLTVQMSSSATRLLLCKTTVTGGGVIHVESGMLGAYAADIVADETAFSFGANGRFMTAGGTYGASMGSLIGVTGSIVNIPSSFTLIVGGDNTSPGAFAGVLQGGGDIVKVGTGTLTLTGANTFSGVTTVNGGVLAVQTGSFPTNNALTVNDGGTFETIIAGTNQIAPSVLNVGSSSGAALGFVNVTNASAAPLKPGTLNIKGTLTINISGAAPAIGTYPLIANYTGGAVKLGTLPPMVTAHLITNNNRISLVVDSIADFSFAVIADPHVHSYWEGNARRLNAAVNWINENAAARKIKMVFLLGDICFEGSDQGRFVVAKVILDQLKVPYVPLLGDNDEQFPYPQGEFYWDNLFHAQFQTLSNAFPNFKKDENYIYDTDDQRYVKLQNFSFDYGPLHFICLDWNGRTNVDNNIGQLNTWNGIGTVPFLSNDLATCQKPLDENVVVLQHIPLEDIADGGAQGFSLLNNYSKAVSALYAGHRHTQQTLTKGQAFTEYVINDVMAQSPGQQWLRLVNVDTNGATIQYSITDITNDVANIKVPVGAWNFNEGSGTQCADNSQFRGVSGNDGYAKNTAWTNGMIGTALSFNGVNSYVAISNLSYAYPLDGEILSSNIAAITVSAWIETSANEGTIIDFDGNHYWSLGINTDGSSGAGHVSWITHGNHSGDHVSSSVSVVNNNTWHHIVATYDSASGVKNLYIDGILEASANAYPAGETLGDGGTHRFGFIGVRSSANTFDGTKNGGWFNGLIDEVRIEPYVWTASDINERFNLVAGKWRFAEGTGKLTANQVDFKNPAVLLEGWDASFGLTGEQQEKTSWLNDAGFETLWFNGTNKVVCHNDPDLQLTGDATFAFWIKPILGSGKVMRPLNKRYNGEFQLAITAEGTLRMEHGSASGFAATTLTSTNFLTSGAWQQVVIVRDMTNHLFRVYRNGLLQNTVGFSANPSLQPTATEYPLLIGDELIGSMDCVQIFAKQLSPSAVFGLYTASKGTLNDSAPVALAASSTGGNALKLSWPVTGPAYVLQTTTSLENPQWVEGPKATVIDGVYEVTVNISTNARQFYRLILK